MKEVWVKKTVWRRYLVEDENIKAVTYILSTDNDRGDELVSDLYDTNDECEYDQEEPLKPLSFEIKEI
jgi:hypothetical protein